MDEGWAALIGAVAAGAGMLIPALMGLNRRRNNQPWASNQHPNLGQRLVRSEVIENHHNDVVSYQLRTTVCGLLPDWVLFHYERRGTSENAFLARCLFGAHNLELVDKNLAVSADGGDLKVYSPASTGAVSENLRRHIEHIALALARSYLITPEPILVQSLIDSVGRGDPRALRLLARHFPNAAERTQALLPGCLKAESRELRLAAAEIADDRVVLRSLALDQGVATDTRRSALTALAAQGELDAVLEVAAGPCFGLELALMSALERVEDPRVLAALQPFVSHDDAEIVERCADFLARRGTATALVAMRERLGHGGLSDGARLGLQVGIDLISERSVQAPGALSLSGEGGAVSIAAGEAGALSDPKDKSS